MGIQYRQALQIRLGSDPRGFSRGGLTGQSFTVRAVPPRCDTENCGKYNTVDRPARGDNPNKLRY
jgi:hypothetical protein